MCTRANINDHIGDVIENLKKVCTPKIHQSV